MTDPSAPPRLSPEFMTRSLAHRGLHDLAASRPENSLAAIRAAVEAGFGIEVDVQPSSDGRAMVFHDNLLDRLTDGTGPISAVDAQALARLRIAGTDERIPTLAQVLATVAGRVPLLIEIKDQDGGLGPGNGMNAGARARGGALERAVAGDLSGYEGPVAVMSFNPHSMAWMAELAPDVPRGLVTCGFEQADWPGVDQTTLVALRDIPDLHRVGGSFISHDARDLSAATVARLAEAGHDVLCWTIRSADDEALARKYARNVTFEGYIPAILPVQPETFGPGGGT